MAMAGIHTHYDTLQVSENASDEVIRGAYRYLSQKWHPDKNPDNPEEAKRVMARLNEAYAVLSDPKRRQEHDAWIAEQRAAGAPGGNGGGTNGKAPPDSGSTDTLRDYYATEIAKGRNFWIWPLAFIGCAMALGLAANLVPSLASLLMKYRYLTLLLLLAGASAVTTSARKKHRDQLLQQHETRILEQRYTEHMRQKTVRQVVIGVSAVLAISGLLAYYGMGWNERQDQLQAAKPDSKKPAPAKPASLQIENACGRDLRFAVHYLPDGGEWRTEGWWNVEANSSTGLRGDLGLIESTNAIFYYYAESLDRKIVWQGRDDDETDATYAFKGRNYRFDRVRLARDADGSYQLKLTC
ncbi:DUF1036 domain-containing protein [Achromobacter sp. K91]|nr:DUF1036 domain-containing protein [Achromobacter sp. K91]